MLMGKIKIQMTNAQDITRGFQRHHHDQDIGDTSVSDNVQMAVCLCFFLFF